MAKEKEFYSFEEALDELRLKEEELKRLVSEGEIRAFRDGDTMKLRRQDVENLRAELSGGEIVDLGESTEELVFEDDGDDSGMATQAIADVDTLIEEVEDVGELDLDDEEEVIPAARSVRRPAAQEEESETTLVRFALIASSLLLIFGMPVVVALSSGNLSGMAKSIAGIFSKELANL